MGRSVARHEILSNGSRALFGPNWDDPKLTIAGGLKALERSGPRYWLGGVRRRPRHHRKNVPTLPI